MNKSLNPAPSAFRYATRSRFPICSGGEATPASGRPVPGLPTDQMVGK